MYIHIKRCLDIIISFLMILFFLPIIIIISIHLKIKFKSIIFKQKRSGKNNKTFLIYKFITVKDNKTSRLTNFYRKTGLDEIPQLFNIIKGDMSLIGPRPWVTEFSKYFTKEQKRRLDVLPGLTGYSQIINDGDIFKRIDRDIYYVDHYNLLFDISIFLKTISFLLLKRKEGIIPFEEDILKLKNQKKKVTLNYSVLMPVHQKDNPIWLEEAIKSVNNQSYQTNNFVIIADGKIDNQLLDVIKHYNNIHFIESKKLGLPSILNKGIKYCKNEWIARIDADDKWTHNKMKKQLLYLENHKDIFLLGTNMQEFTENKFLGKTKVPINQDQIIKYSKYRNPFRHSSVVFSKKIVTSLGGYKNIKYFEDYDLWMRILLKYDTHNLEEALTHFRINKDLYDRRGGKSYLKVLLNFEKNLLKNKQINLFQFIYNITIRSIVCILPNYFRKTIYEKILRSNK